MRGFTKRADQCRFCRCCRCLTRIVAIGFDEVACRDHAGDLETFANAELPPGWSWELILSTGPQRRGWHDIDVRRPASRAPVEIAARPARTVVPVLSREERDVMRHALGIEQGPDGRDRFRHRNHFATAADDPVWVGLQARGLAGIVRRSTPTFPSATWHVTPAGRVLVGAQLDDRGDG